MLAGVPVLADAVAELAAHHQDDRRRRSGRPLEAALDDGVALLALTIDERAIILASLQESHTDGAMSSGSLGIDST